MTALPNSHNHNTELATIAHHSQSTDSGCGRECLLEKRHVNDRHLERDSRRHSAHSHWLVNRCTNALRSSDRALKTLNIWNSINVVNAIVCA